MRDGRAICDGDGNEWRGIVHSITIDSVIRDSFIVVNIVSMDRCVFANDFIYILHNNRKHLPVPFFVKNIKYERLIINDFNEMLG